jgi:hypothetical protein
MANLRGLYDKIVSLVKSSDVVSPDTYTPISTDLVAVYDSNGPSTESGDILAPKKFVSVTDIGTGGGGGGGSMNDFTVQASGGVVVSLDGDTYGEGPLTIENASTLYVNGVAIPSGLTWEGPYSAGTTYQLNDVVSNVASGVYSTWLYINSTPASGEALPVAPSTYNSYWAQLGTQGPAGSTGPAGPNVGSAVLGFRTVTANTQLYANAAIGTTTPVPDVNDRGITILVNSVSDVIITIPFNLSTNSVTGFPIGYQVSIITINTGPVSIGVAGGVGLYSADNARNLRTQYSGCTLVRQGANTWYMFGDLTNIA